LISDYFGEQFQRRLGHWFKTGADTAEPKSQGFFYILIEINAKV